MPYQKRTSKEKKYLTYEDGDSPVSGESLSYYFNPPPSKKNIKYDKNRKNNKKIKQKERKHLQKLETEESTITEEFGTRNTVKNGTSESESEESNCDSSWCAKDLKEKKKYADMYEILSDQVEREWEKEDWVIVEEECTSGEDECIGSDVEAFMESQWQANGEDGRPAELESEVVKEEDDELQLNNGKVLDERNVGMEEAEAEKKLSKETDETGTEMEEVNANFEEDEIDSEKEAILEGRIMILKDTLDKLRAELAEAKRALENEKKSIILPGHACTIAEPCSVATQLEERLRARREAAAMSYRAGLHQVEQMVSQEISQLEEGMNKLQPLNKLAANWELPQHSTYRSLAYKHDYMLVASEMTLNIPNELKSFLNPEFKELKHHQYDSVISK